MTISPAGKITDVNSATETATGLKREQLVGTDFSDYFTDPQHAKEGYQQVLEQGSVRDYELDLRHRDGHITPVLYNASLFRDEAGHIAGVFAAARDMTEHLRAEEQLHLQTTALESAANGVFITDKKGNIQWSNPAFNRMTGYTSDEIIGKNPRLLNSGKQDNAFYSHLWQTILAGQVWQGELVNRRKDGSEYYEEQTIAPVFNKNQTITHFVVVKQDITERKVADALVRADSLRSQVLADFSRGLSEAGTDYQAVIDQATRQVAALSGDLCTMRKLIEEPISLELVSICSPDQESVSRELRTALNLFMQTITARVVESGEAIAFQNLTNGSTEYFQFPAVARLADLFNISNVLVVPLRVQSRVIGTLSLYGCSTKQPSMQIDLLLLQNLADRAALAINNAWLYADLKKSLETEQSLRTQIIQVEKFSAVGRMLASIAHEMNNPLQTVKNCLYLARREVPEGQGHDYLDMASSEIQRISRLVAQLREIYRPRPAGFRQPVVLNQVLDDLSLLIEPHLQREHVNLTRPLEEDQFIVNGIADQLKQVFLNISLNAIEAMQPEGGALAIQIVPSEDQSQAGVKFTDTGPGMPPEVISKLFQPLFTTKEFGLGLGLSISNDIVQRHGGVISVQSQPGQGAEFIVWLPVSQKTKANSPAEER